MRTIHTSARTRLPLRRESHAVAAISDGRHQFASLDGLRGLAIALVLWCHLEITYSTQVQTGPIERVLGGYAYSGVVLFFVLSGFLLFLPYARALLSAGRWPSASNFYVRRGLRILPSYYAVLLVLPVYLLLVHPGTTNPEFNPAQVFLGVTLLYDVRSDAYHLATLFDSPLWSLTLEWQFYLILPWLALSLARLSAAIRSGPLSHLPRHWQVCSGLAVLAVLGLGVRALAAMAHYNWGYPTSMHEPGWLSVLLAVCYSARGKYLEVFALGMMASTFYVAIVEQGRVSARWRTVIGLGALAAALVGLAACLPWAIQADRLFEIHWMDNFPPQAGWAWSVLGDEALGICYTFLLVGVLLVRASARIFSWTPLRMLGHIAYSVYLWHMLWILLFVRYGSPLRLSTIVLLVTTIMLWSLVAYVLVEQPFLRLQRKIRSASQLSV